MKQNSLEVIKASIHAMIQDMGRFGYEDIGVTPSGVLDEHAYLWANKLLGNDPKQSNAIEISYGGLELLAHCDTVIAVCGASTHCTINDNCCQMWQSYPINKGDRIKVGKFYRGQKLYLVVKGGFELEKTYGSYSFSQKEDFGTMLHNGDIIPIRPSHHPHHHMCVPYKYIPKYQNSFEVRFLPDDRYFDQQHREKFVQSTFHITNQISRMGIRLEGDMIASKVDGIISEPTTLGTIQIPKSGQPIILFKERQTIGGYPYIGQVHPLDLFTLSQLKPGASLRFRAAFLSDVQKELKEFYNFFLM